LESEEKIERSVRKPLESVGDTLENVQGESVGETTRECPRKPSRQGET